MGVGMVDVDVGQQYGRGIGDLGGGERWREGARQASAFAVGVGEVRVDVRNPGRTFDRNSYLPEPQKASDRSPTSSASILPIRPIPTTSPSRISIAETLLEPASMATRLAQAESPSRRDNARIKLSRTRDHRWQRTST